MTKGRMKVTPNSMQALGILIFLREAPPRSLRGRRNPVLHVDAKCCAHALCCGHNDPKSFYRADS